MELKQITIEANGNEQPTVLYDTVKSSDVVDIKIAPTKEGPSFDMPILVKEPIYLYTGVVYDDVTGEPIPNVSVDLYNGDHLIEAWEANSKGAFAFDVTTKATRISFSHVNYKPTSAAANIYENNYYYIAVMKPDDVILPPVVLPPAHPASSKKGNWLLLGLAAAAIVESQKKKAVGKIDTGTVIAAGTGVALIFGFSTIKKLFEGIGLWSSQDTKDLDNEAGNPYSPWSPAFWKQGPAGTMLITTATAEQYIKDLSDAFGWWDDEEEKAIAVFKRFKTQSQLSFFSDLWQQWGNGDLLQWLRGGAYPNDRLSDGEVAEINDYIKKLPKYKA